MNIQVGNTYKVYGKINNMKRYAPMSGNGFAANIINAELFTINSEYDKQQFIRLIDGLNNDNDGHFEPRIVKGY